MRILAIIGAVLLGALLMFVGALTARWWGQPGSEAPTAAGTAEPLAVSGSPARPATLDLQTVRELLAVLEPARRAAILNSAETFGQFVQQETVNQSVMAAAYANGADQMATIGVLMARAAQRVLAEAYLNQVVRVNLDPDFPSDTQVREAYDNNQDKFHTPERLHLWQIFIPLAAGAPDAELQAASKLADQLVADLRGGKADFATLAKAHSAHEASRLNDGYMGLVKVDDLLPVIADATVALDVDSISQPLATESGLHIIRRGPTVAGELIDFSKVTQNVRKRMKDEAAARVRQAAVDKIGAQYPLSAPVADVEAWRETLLVEMRSGDTATAAADQPPQP